MPSLSSVASAGLGLGLGGGGLEKLTISYEKRRPRDFLGSIEALFNPNEINISSNVTWEARGGAVMASTTLVEQEFRQVTAQTLSITLFFDTYESHADKLSLGHMMVAVLPTLSLFASPDATSVQAHTSLITRLTQVNPGFHRPPICKLAWGQFNIFTGVLAQLSQKFTMFMPDGTPVRATLDCTFAEYQTEAAALELQSADVLKTHTIGIDETLPGIAAQLYNDPTLWRHIARANNIVNPRTLQPGTVLIIPTLT